MRGFVPTPERIVDRMVERLFRGRSVDGGTTVLDPGCGEGLFIEGIVRWCRRLKRPIPRIVGIELHPGRCQCAREKFKKFRSIEIREADFLVESREKFDFIVGNPPYVSIQHLDEDEKKAYRARYKAAKGRFDLYMLFFEQAMAQLADGGRLVFITPEKYLYVDTARALRHILSQRRLAELAFVREDAFVGLVTYPLITVVENRPAAEKTKIGLRDGSRRDVKIPDGESSWLSSLASDGPALSQRVLSDVCIRISCGVATGADSVFVRQSDGIPRDFAQFAYPTIAGRQLRMELDELKIHDVMLIPYDRKGTLLDENALGALKSYLREPEVKRRLLARTCADRKAWYSFHDNMPLADILQPKILCKDISARPRFWIDREGTIVPRHSVYYIVPKSPKLLEPLAEYLNSNFVADWLARECQRAANGYLRLQSSVLKRIPISESMSAVS